MLGIVTSTKDATFFSEFKYKTYLSNGEDGAIQMEQTNI